VRNDFSDNGMIIRTDLKRQKREKIVIGTDKKFMKKRVILAETLIGI
jgi:hypothetical protein